MTSENRVVLHRKLATLYPADEARAAAAKALAPVLIIGEGGRIALACVKLAGGDFARLEDCVRAALSDYRDVLAWAESPRQMRLGPGAPPVDQAQARRADAEEYASWLQAP
ncbi:MAG: hypothetical protein EHM60_01085 [Lysobacterales bacterium]|nr:MAG: hypothetical protein EHM60_01085 [Xanthomonadales bacterium]